MSISALTATIDAHGEPQGTVSIAFDRYDGARCQYSYEIREPDGTLLAEGSDLRSGYHEEPTLPNMLGTLLSFLGACGESYGDQQRTGRESETANMFPERCAQWADAIGGELAMACEELIGAEAAGYSD